MIHLEKASKFNFFDRMQVIRFVDEKERNSMNRIGSRIKLTAQRSMRPNKPNKKGVTSPSKPGKPPKRTGSMGEKLSKIWYTYDRIKHRVIVGPLKFNWDAFPEATVPETHEFGKTVSIYEAEFRIFGGAYGATRWLQVGRKGKQRALANGNRVRKRSLNYPARPFMGPALDKNMNFIRDTWADASGKVGA